MLVKMAFLLIISTTPAPKPPICPMPNTHATKYTTGCPYCCCHVINDGTSSAKQLLKVCESGKEGKMCADMCAEEAKKAGVKVAK